MPPASADTAYKNAFVDACTNGDLPKVREALTSGKLSPEDLDDGLGSATQEAHPDIVAALFDGGVPISPYAIACLCGNEEGRQDPRVVRLYLNCGLEPSQCTTTRGEPLLRLLPAPCARLLLERGVDPNWCGPKKIPPLASALEKAENDSGALFDLLLEYGATMDSSLFFYAISRSMSDTEFKVKFLLGKGLDPNATSADWGAPLHCAIRFALEGVIQILLDAGADPTARPMCKQFRGKSPTEAAETMIRINSRIPSVKAKYQKILEVVTDAQVGHSATSSQKIADESQSKKPNMDLKCEHDKPTVQKHNANGQRIAIKNTSRSAISTDSIVPPVRRIYCLAADDIQSGASHEALHPSAPLAFFERAELSHDCRTQVGCNRGFSELHDSFRKLEKLMLVEFPHCCSWQIHPFCQRRRFRYRGDITLQPEESHAALAAAIIYLRPASAPSRGLPECPTC